MELQLVSNEIGISLKELGFDWIVTNFYRKGRIYSIEPHNCNEKECIISAPTQALVCKWFRDVHNIRIFPRYSDANGTYNVEVRIPKNDVWQMKRVGNIRSVGTYEQAEEIGIELAINILKENYANTNN